MRPFDFHRASDRAQAQSLGAHTGQGQTDAATQFLAGGTTLVDLMKLDVLRPETVVDISGLRRDHAGIAVGPDSLRLGSLATMSEVARHPQVRTECPALAQSLDQAASPQLRNMATLGGNVLQRTRCPYYRDPTWPACNKRNAGSGCSALSALNADHAVLGVDESCIAQYPGDLGVVLAAFEAEIELESPAGRRTMPFGQLHRAADGHPEMETRLRPGEIILGFAVPRRAWAKRSLYLKVRNRASYEFALASAAVGLEREGDIVRQVRIGLGGLAYRPWRSAEAEAALAGRRLDEAAAREAAEAAFAGARARQDNGFKIELGRRTLVRALMEANNLQASEGTG